MLAAADRRICAYLAKMKLRRPVGSSVRYRLLQPREDIWIPEKQDLGPHEGSAAYSEARGQARCHEVEKREAAADKYSG